MIPSVHHLVCLSLVTSTASAFSFPSPFKKARFTENGLVLAGDLGLGRLDGKVVALGDWDGDQSLDVFTLTNDQKEIHVWLWDHVNFKYTKAKPTISTKNKVRNVVPGDFNHDGRLDLLVLSEIDDGGWWNEIKELSVDLYIQQESGEFDSPVSLDRSTLVQPTILDSTGNLRPDLLGLMSEKNGQQSSLKLWQNDGHGNFTIQEPMLDSSKVCTLSEPHSNAFVDLDGDCLADLFLHCTDTYTGENTFQIWVNRRGSFVLSHEGQFPKGSGMVTFADIDRDGTLDMIFPVCKSFSASTGIGQDCSVNVVYNQQIPLCSTTSTVVLDKEGKRICRDSADLCVADSGFKFEFDLSTGGMTSTPLSTLFPSISSPKLALYDVSQSPAVPLPLRLGDINMDGYPDVLLLLSPSSGHVQAEILVSSPCSAARCQGKAVEKKRRDWKVEEKGMAVVRGITDVTRASFLDLDEDGSLDILIQRSGKQDGTRISFIQNNFYNDAFFLKTRVLTGVCDGVCQPSNRSFQPYHPYGVAYSGASFKFTILDTNGRKAVTQVAQLPQTAYMALQMPYALFGLGRTNNYVENLFIGTTSHSSPHWTSIEGVIPNSQVVISPPTSSLNPDGSETTGRWSWQLYLHPGEYVPWVTASTVFAALILAGVVGFLHLREKREDEIERRRALHRLNVGAM
ncbi:Predicted membrane protein [Phaffia rhodozyma]|uniref:Predicted membrane protein n=1 Tax=Phaffia rhodozyma TaxID=264483 RepID=A0A0F7SRC6_PHARH|nr:Predicted membrane protein [Phaffia rhodozyma]